MNVGRGGGEPGPSRRAGATIGEPRKKKKKAKPTANNGPIPTPYLALAPSPISSIPRAPRIDVPIPPPPNRLVLPSTYLRTRSSPNLLDTPPAVVQSRRMYASNLVAPPLIVPGGTSATPRIQEMPMQTGRRREGGRRRSEEGLRGMAAGNQSMASLGALGRILESDPMESAPVQRRRRRVVREDQEGSERRPTTVSTREEGRAMGLARGASMRRLSVWEGLPDSGEAPPPFIPSSRSQPDPPSPPVDDDPAPPFEARGRSPPPTFEQATGLVPLGPAVSTLNSSDIPIPTVTSRPASIRSGRSTPGTQYASAPESQAASTSGDEVVEEAETEDRRMWNADISAGYGLMERVQREAERKRVREAETTEESKSSRATVSQAAVPSIITPPSAELYDTQTSTSPAPAVLPIPPDLHVTSAIVPAIETQPDASLVPQLNPVSERTTMSPRTVSQVPPALDVGIVPAVEIQAGASLAPQLDPVSTPTIMSPITTVPSEVPTRVSTSEEIPPTATNSNPIVESTGAEEAEETPKTDAPTNQVPKKTVRKVKSTLSRGSESGPPTAGSSTLSAAFSSHTRLSPAIEPNSDTAPRRVTKKASGKIVKKPVKPIVEAEKVISEGSKLETPQTHSVKPRETGQGSKFVEVMSPEKAPQRSGESFARPSLPLQASTAPRPSLPTKISSSGPPSEILPVVERTFATPSLPLPVPTAHRPSLPTKTSGSNPPSEMIPVAERNSHSPNGDIVISPAPKRKLTRGKAIRRSSSGLDFANDPTLKQLAPESPKRPLFGESHFDWKGDEITPGHTLSANPIINTQSPPMLSPSESFFQTGRRLGSSGSLFDIEPPLASKPPLPPHREAALKRRELVSRSPEVAPVAPPKTPPPVDLRDPSRPRTFKLPRSEVSRDLLDLFEEESEPPAESSAQAAARMEQVKIMRSIKRERREWSVEEVPAEFLSMQVDRPPTPPGKNMAQKRPPPPPPPLRRTLVSTTVGANLAPRRSIIRSADQPVTPRPIRQMSVGSQDRPPTAATRRPAPIQDDELSDHAPPALPPRPIPAYRPVVLRQPSGFSHSDSEEETPPVRPISQYMGSPVRRPKGPRPPPPPPRWARMMIPLNDIKAPLRPSSDRTQSDTAVSVDRIPRRTASEQDVRSSPVEYTDLDVLVSRLEGSGREYEGFSQITAFLGPGKSLAATPEALSTLLPGPITVESRRVTGQGKVKLKLSLLGVRVSKCPICLAQFKKDDQGVLLPECGHVSHEACAGKWFREDYRCFVCRVPLLKESGQEVSSGEGRREEGVV